MVNIPVEPLITEYLHRKASKNKIPLSGTFELTPVCNMNCKMCYVRMSKEEQENVRPLRSVEEWVELAKKAKERGMLYLLLTGGEPFLYPHFRELLEELNKLGFVISINSNATMIDEEVVEWLKKVAPTRINITLYGASNETYARLCNNPNGFTQVINAIHLLKNAGISIKINCSVTPYNAGDLEEIIAFCTKEHLIVQPTSYMFPPMRKDCTKIGTNNRFTSEDAAYYAAKIEMLLNGKERFLEKVKNDDQKMTLSSSNQECLDMEGDCIRCRAGKSSFWVTWEGKLYPCGMIFDESFHDVFQVGFDKAWEYAIKYASEIRLPVACKNCELRDTCKACAAMVLTETGNYHTVPEYRCRMTKAYPDACKKLVKEIEEGGK